MQRGAVYAAPDDRENLGQGFYVVRVAGSSPRDTLRNRQRALDLLMQALERGRLCPLGEIDRCFPHGLGADDLIFIPPYFTPLAPEELLTMDTPLEEHEILLAATEIIELAKLKVDLARSFLAAQEYRDLVIKVVDPQGGHLTAAECQTVTDKGFAKAIKGLAEAKVKVTQWYDNSTGRHQLILNELAFMGEEIAATLALGESPEAGSAPTGSE